MIDRYRAWLGAGVLAGGMSAAVLTGAGVASADDTAPSTADTRASSGSDDEAKVNQTKADDTKADDTKADDTKADETEADETEADETEADEVDGNDPPDTFGEVEPVADPGPSNGDGNGQDRGSLDMAAPEPGVGSSDSPAEIDSDTNVDTADMWEEPDAAEGVPSVFLTGIETDLGSPEGAAVMRRAAVESPSIVTGLLNLFEALDNIGTAFYNLYTGTMQFLAGPARAPFGSRVRVETSSLTIGSGVVVPADWYFPPGRVEPKGLVYLQHGMLATSAFYSATAAHLAEKTHSIVVVPTLTWNIFDAAGYPLMLSHTHRAIAELFAGDRAALTESAQRAGYNKDLPTKVVLVGHSAGGGLVAGTARYMVERGSGGNLAGVLMLDGAGFGGRLSVDLAKIPESIPVYNLAADPDTWNNYGDASRRLHGARPDTFNGIVIDGGRHSDAMQSSSPLVQMAAYFATGFSTPWHIAINQALASGWIGDMLSGTYTPRLYASSGSVTQIAVGLMSLSRVRSVPASSGSYGSGGVCVDEPFTSVCPSPPERKMARRNASTV